MSYWAWAVVDVPNSTRGEGVIIVLEFITLQFRIVIFYNGVPFYLVVINPKQPHSDKGLPPLLTPINLLLRGGDDDDDNTPVIMGGRVQLNKPHKTRFSSKSSRNVHKVPSQG